MEAPDGLGVSPEGQRKHRPVSPFLPLTLNSPPSKVLFSLLYLYQSFSEKNGICLPRSASAGGLGGAV